MAQFLFSARNPHGVQVTERIEAVNVSAARYALETRRYLDIVFHTDDMTAALRAVAGTKRDKDDDFWTPEMELRARRGRTNLSRMVSPLKRLSVCWVPLLFGTIYGAYRGPWGWELWLAVVLDAWFIKFYVLLILPGISYNLLLRAAVWHRWGRVRFWVGIIRWLKGMGRASISEFELCIRLAAVSASEGKLDEALRLLARFEKDPKVAKGSYFGRLASIYEMARDFDGMLRCKKAAIEQGSGSAGELIAYAGGLIERRRDVNGARQALALAKEKEITELAARYVAFYEGLISIEEGDYAAAQGSLVQALKMAACQSEQPLVQGWVIFVKAYLCIAVGHLGEKAKARQLLRAVKRFLTVRREEELLERCRAAAA
jgi:hypothetical protein